MTKWHNARNTITSPHIFANESTDFLKRQNHQKRIEIESR